MSKNDTPVKNVIIGITGLFAVLVTSIAITKCSGKNVKGDDSANSSLKLTYNVETNTSASSKTSYNVSTASSSSLQSEDEGPVPAPEEPAETKQRAFKLKNVSPELVHDCFVRIFNDLPNVSTPNIEFESNTVLVSKRINFNCPVCGAYQVFNASLKSNGDLDFENISIHEHMPNVTISLAEVFSNYLNKESAVLIGKNYQNDFGIVKKEDTWYFEFLGLNLPIFKGETDIRTKALLDAFGDTLIEGVLDPNGDGYSLSNFEYTDENLKNAIPLLFYKHFGNLLVEYKAIDAADKIIADATKDAANSSINANYLNPSLTINENISKINSFFGNYYTLGNFNNTSYDEYYTPVNLCFLEMFKAANPGFQNTSDIYIKDNELKIDNGSSFEGVTSCYIGLSEYQNFFPFFNNFSAVPGLFDGTRYSNNPGILTFCDELGRSITLINQHANEIDFYEDGYSHATNISDYFFTWGVTDSYYFILDYMVSNCYLKSAKLLYANTYNDLTKTTSTIDETVLVKNTVSEDPTEDNLTTLYGVVDKSKLLLGQVVKMGFDVKINDKITTYLTDKYTTSVVIDNTTFADVNSYYFYHVMPYQDTAYEVRFFVEYNDRIEYSKWR